MATNVFQNLKFIEVCNAFQLYKEQSFNDYVYYSLTDIRQFIYSHNDERVITSYMMLLSGGMGWDRENHMWRHIYTKKLSEIDYVSKLLSFLVIILLSYPS